jgi:hypothetical protein
MNSSQGINMKKSNLGQIKDKNSLLTQMEFASGILTNNLKKSIRMVPDLPQQESLHDKKSISGVSGISFKRSIKKKLY